MPKFNRQAFSPVIIVPLILGMFVAACASNDNGHTTATTVVTPPRRQVLTVVEVQPTPVPTKTETREVVSEVRPGVDPTKPLLTFNLPDGKTFKSGEVVVLDFSLVNAKLKGDGGEYRVRYFVDDDDPRWIDDLKPIGLADWLPGKHTIRLELIGPDGWPYRNGDRNIATREIIVLP
jgi:hypothetical protein